MQESIKHLRKFFKSKEWTDACLEDQSIVKKGGWSEGTNGVKLYTQINLALDFEYQFNEMAHKYMQWRKTNGMEPDI